MGKTSKAEKKSKKSSKESKKRSSKKEHKHKKHKKHRRHSSSTSSSSSGSDSSDGYGRAGSALSQLERERAAVAAARYLLSTQQAIRKSFRELLWELDNGRSVGLSGVPDELLRSQLQHILELLGLKCTKGQFWLPTGTPPTLSVLGFVFDEAPRAGAQPPPGMPTPAAQQQEQEQQQQQHTHPQPDLQQQQEEEAEQGVAVGPVGPPDRPAVAAAADTGPDVEAGGAAAQAAAEEQQPEGEEEPPEESAPKRRRVGPAAPSAELLAAAAAYHADMEAAGGYVDADAAAGPGPEGPGEDPLVGPPPPEFIDEADAAPADAREAAVVRVLRVLREAAADAPAGPAAGPQAAAAVVADPYAVLGVEADADTGSVRKAYWRLSLLVHPDKCSHPAAHEAFQAVSKAAKLLQDAEARKAHDAAAEDAALRKAALAAAAAAERQAAWATARGEAVPAEVAAQLAAARAAAAGPVARDSWMTDLPAEGRSAASALAGLSQVSQTSFNRFGTRSRGDTSGWTDTPEMAAKRAAGLLTDSSAGGPRLALKGPGAAGEGSSAPVSAALKAAMAQHSQSRQKSLLELHAERQAAGKGGEKQKGDKKEKKAKGDKKEKEKDKKDKDKKKPPAGPAAAGTKEDWGGMPWKPWDREKDLSAPASKPRGAADLLKAAGSLGNRFSSGR